MTSKHTPGPWFPAARYPHGMTSVCDYNGGKGPYRQIAITEYDHVSPDEAEANARLIAEAPAMLDALRKLEPLIAAAHKSARNKAVYGPLEEALAPVRAILSRIGG